MLLFSPRAIIIFRKHVTSTAQPCEWILYTGSLLYGSYTVPMVGRPNNLVKLDYDDPKYATVVL